MATSGSQNYKSLNYVCVLVFGMVLAFAGAIAAHAQTRQGGKGTARAGVPGRGAGEATSGSRSGTKLMVSGKSLHLSCSRSLRDLTRNRLECFGNVYIRRPSELLTSDYAVMDLNTEQLHAEGNVVYFTPDTVIYGNKMDFNFVTETGVIEDGRVESDKYQLLGEKIERLAADHFLAYDGEYTTCRDCPASWKIAGKKVDLTINGYAHLSNVFIKINEASALFLPYAIIPVKTKRQSGLLFPKIQPASQSGFTFLQPYFWAISRSQDATLGAGYYAIRGPKGELEYRYALSSRSSGQLNAFYLHDKQFASQYQNRWAANYKHNLELPFGMEQKLQYLDAADRDYSRTFTDDIPGRGEPSLVSSAGLAKTSRTASGFVTAKRIRNLVTSSQVGFDPNTVQVLPSFSVASSEHRLIDRLPVYWGISGNYTRFTRSGPDFDAIYPEGFVPPTNNFFLPGETPLRKGQRFTLVPELYAPLRVADVIEVIPSVQYRSYYYLFDSQFAPPTARGYLLAQNEVATTIERVYGTSVKHKFRPALTYSNIPMIGQRESHPFITQIKKNGNQFDEFDIVPITNDTQLYFIPLGNSLSYRLSNKFILKTDEELTPGETTYRKAVDLTAGQSINFIEFHESAATREPLSRFYSLLTVDTLRVAGNGTFYYYPYIKRSTIDLNASYIFAKYTRRLLNFERSMSLGYSSNSVTANSKTISGGLNFSINDYFALSGRISYRFPLTQNNVTSPGVVLSTDAGITYQSPSQCYKLSLLGGWSIDNPKVAITFNVPINLSGEGYTNLQEGGGFAGQGG